jgi:hypothetical protein
MSLEALHRVLEASGARRLSRGLPVYGLRRTRWPPFGRAEDLHERQVAVMEAVRALPWQAFLRCSRDPGERGLTGWPRAARDTWRVPPHETARHLLEGFLGPGSWTLYLAPYAIDPTLLPDTFRAELADVSRFVESHGIPVLLDAWQDNSEWRIVVDPAAVPELAAA